MAIRVRKLENAAILDLEGPLRMGEPVQEFRDTVESLLEDETKNIAVNLAGVPEMDSSGMGVLVRVYTTVTRAGGKCRCFGVSKKLMQVLKMVRLDSVLELVEDEAAALKDL